MVQPQAVQDGCVEVMDVNRRILYPGSVLHLRNRGPYYGKKAQWMPAWPGLSLPDGSKVAASGQWAP